MSGRADFPNWFDVTARANFERHLLPLADQPLKCLQLGVFTGDASLWIMRNLPQANLADVDTWEGSEEHDGLDFSAIYREYCHRIELFHVTGRIEWHRSTSADFLARRRTRYDFIYIDGDHTAPAVLTDAVLAWRLLRPGALMAFDDYTWHHPVSRLHEPSPAIDAFVRVFAEQLEVVDKGAQCWVRKL